MPRRLETRIWQSEAGYYLFSDIDESGEVITTDFKADSPEYFAWIAGLKSFHFESKHGRFTARRETRKNKGGTVRQETYWSAYRKHNHKQLRKYIGTSDKLSIATLEDIARQLTDVCATLPMKVKVSRKKPVQRSVLLGRIADRDKAIAERDKTIEDLQTQIYQRDQQIKDLKKQVKLFEIASKKLYRSEQRELKS